MKNNKQKNGMCNTWPNQCPQKRQNGSTQVFRKNLQCLPLYSHPPCYTTVEWKCPISFHKWTFHSGERNLNDDHKTFVVTVSNRCRQNIDVSKCSRSTKIFVLITYSGIPRITEELWDVQVVFWSCKDIGTQMENWMSLKLPHKWT